MSLFEIKELQEKRGEIYSAVCELQKRKNDENRSYTSEEEQTFDKLYNELEQADARIATVQRDLKLAAINNESKDMKAEFVTARPGNRNFTERDRQNALRGWLSHGTQYSRAENTEAALRMGMDPNKPLVLRFPEKGATFGSSTNVSNNAGLGQDLVQTDIMATVLLALKQFGTIRNLARVERTAAGNPLRIPVSSDVDNGATVIAQNTQANTTEIDFNYVELDAYKFVSRIEVSRELMEDAVINVADFIGQRLGERIARGTELKYAQGAGSTEPQGVVGSNTPLTSTVTTAHEAQVAYSEIVSAIYNIDPAYLNSPKFAIIGHSSFRKQLLTLVDSQSRPLWQPVFTSGFTDTPRDLVFGYPFYVNNSLPTMALNSKSCVLGDWNYWFIRDVNEIILMRDPYSKMDYDVTRFYAYFRTDSNLIFNAGGSSATSPLQYIQSGSAS